ncbi:aldehyde dehydrogenase [Rhizodiscina lignyota]|uniref:Aldehyde dehydrogenase n=1 Tax=Rhizodiscina lignyota TaxID=1504668 RepID=A0A9P4I9D5_9PEZI|nr:aldehyde dehydrogenase [Rhizodiscina lignyota]
MASDAVNGGAHFTVPLIINGKEVITSTTFPVISPSSKKEIWSSSSAGKEEAIAAIEAAEAAFPSWSRTKPSERRDIFLRAANILEKRADEAKQIMQDETGAVANFTGFNLMTTVEQLRDIAGRIVVSLSGTIPVSQTEGTSALILKEPFGVIFSIAPWNAPFILGQRAISYAIAVGNTAVLKGSEMSPRCFQLISQCFQEAGLPGGVLNVIYTRPQDAAEVTKACIEAPQVKKITFTGSTAVGSVIAELGGKSLKPVVMELGGKASAIVCDDAELDHAAFQCALGAFIHSGQVCMSTERILVHESILESFSKALTKAINILGQGASDSPILISPVGVKKNHELINGAVNGGAKILHGDINIKETTDTRMRPIVVSGVTPEMDLYHKESFGPSVSLIAISSDDEAVKIANDTDYGLSGAVFTKDLVRGLRIAKSIETGAVHINGMSVHDEPNLPHGGAKKSGFGRFNGQQGMDEFLRTKVVTFLGVDL